MLLKYLLLLLLLLLRLLVLLHSFTTEVQELSNAKTSVAFFNSSKRKSTVIEEVAYSSLRWYTIYTCSSLFFNLIFNPLPFRSVFNPASVVPLSHFKLCPLAKECHHAPFADYGYIRRHMQIFHASTPEDIMRLLGTRDECKKRWEKDGATLVDKLRIEYEDSLFWKCGFSGPKKMDRVVQTTTLAHRWAKHSMSGQKTFSYGPTQRHVYIIWLFATKRRL